MARAAAAVAVVVIMIAATVAVVVVVIIAHAAARILAAAGVVADTVIIVAAVAVAAAARVAPVLAAVMTRLTARVPRRLLVLPRLPRPRRLLRLPPPSNFGANVNTALRLTVPSLLALSGGRQKPQEPLLDFEKRFFFRRSCPSRSKDDICVCPPMS